MIDELIKQMRSSASSAIEQNAQSLGLPLIKPAEHRAALQNMTEKDLDLLAEEYGTDQVVHWLNRVAGG